MREPQICCDRKPWWVLKPLKPESRCSKGFPCSSTMWRRRGWRFGGQLHIQTFFNEELRWTKQSWHHTLNENCKDISCVYIYWNMCVWVSQLCSMYLLGVFVNMLHFCVFLWILYTLFTFAACILAKKTTCINASGYLTLSWWAWHHQKPFTNPSAFQPRVPAVCHGT